MPFFDHKLNNIFAEYFFYILAVVFDYLPREVLPCSSPSQSLRQWCYSQGLEENKKWLMSTTQTNEQSVRIPKIL